MDRSGKDCVQFRPVNMQFIEQFVESVVSYSSKYNNSQSVSYAPENIIGKPVKYPCYGDFPDTYMLRSYGEWWSKSESAQKEYMPQDVGSIISEDFITVKFEQPLIATRVVIYETYNPGAVVRLWGGFCNQNWNLLWEGHPQVCETNARLFSPPIRIVKKLINMIRIDFNQSSLVYHTSLDAVLVAGYKTKTYLQSSIIACGILHMDEITEKRKQNKMKEIPCTKETSFFILPYEVIVYIFGYLDLKSLTFCAQVNRMFNAASNDSALYRQISLKRYWHLANDTTLEYFTPKCSFLRKLDLSWCGFGHAITEAGFTRFLRHCGKFLTHLSLGNSHFVEEQTLKCISDSKELIDLRLRNCHLLRPDDFLPLGYLHNLRAIDLYSSNIDDQSLAKILKNNRNLEHIIIDLCEQLTELDLIAEIVASYNKNCRTFSCWKTQSITSEGIKQLAKCANLRELDVGWCLVLNDPGDCLSYIAQGCPNLIKLAISCCRGLGDHQLVPIIRHCKKIKQLDLLGTRNISGDICESALLSFADLELLDVSFCDVIKCKQVAVWKLRFPNVTIQRSCAFVIPDYWNQ